MASIKSLYIVENVNKYHGNNTNNIVCRSSWERAVCKYFDNSPNVKGWSSESVVVRYFSPLDNKHHRYYIDFAVELVNGKKYLIEVKPYKETIPPKLPKSGRRSKSFVYSEKTWIINNAKWKAAQEYAKFNGVEFAIWHEHVLKKLGIKISK